MATLVGKPMPFVNIKVTPDGLTPEKKAALIAGVTELLRVELNKNPETTVVIIDEARRGMSGGAAPVWLSVLMLLAGFGIPIMAALNSGLGMRLGSPVAAAFVLFIVGTIATGVVVLATGTTNPFKPIAPFGFWLGGLLVAFYVLSVTLAAPRIGVGNAIFLCDRD
eukprot:gene14753-19832_t